MGATLVQLETFVRVAELGNYTRVAEELHLTQPGVTQHVRALERQYGVALVDVVGRRPVLTDAGRFLALRAREVIGGMAALEREMGEFAAVRAGTLALGATLTIGSYVVPALLARFTAAHPDIVVQVEVANTATMAARLRAGAVGLALVEGPLEGDDLVITPFQEDRLRLAVPQGHRLSRRSEVAPQELAHEAFVWREVGSGTRALAERALAAAGATPRAVLELPSGEGVARAVEAGMGVAILSELVLERPMAQGRLVALNIAGIDLRRTLRVVHPRCRTLSPAARAFVALLTD